jgi:hypothetical protein
MKGKRRQAQLLAQVSPMTLVSNKPFTLFHHRVEVSDQSMLFKEYWRVRESLSAVAAKAHPKYLNVFYNARFDC